MKIFAEKFRGFETLEIDLDKIAFLVGDNSSGKSSILYLIDAVCHNDLQSIPMLDENFGASRYDYFSPYFDFKDVCFGFIAKAEQVGLAGKVITVSKGSEFIPSIVRCTYWIPGHLITLRVSGGKVEYRVLDAPDEITPAQLMKVHRKRGGFDQRADIPVDEIAETSALAVILSSKEEKLDFFIRAIWSVDINPCRTASPLRGLPSKFYQNKRMFRASGTHFARVWLDLKDRKFDVADYVDKFGVEAGLFEKMNVRLLTDEVDDPPLFVTVGRGGNDFSLDQVGLGISQIIPIVIDSIFSLKLDKNPLLVHQPELHLHPTAQAAFGSFLYRMSREGLVSVLETHSSFIIDRFRSNWRDTLINKKESSIENVRGEIIFCENSSSGNIATHIGIENDGTLSGEPDSYHRFFVDELMRTMF